MAAHPSREAYGCDLVSREPLLAHDCPTNNGEVPIRLEIRLRTALVAPETMWMEKISSFIIGNCGATENSIS